MDALTGKSEAELAEEEKADSMLKAVSYTHRTMVHDCLVNVAGPELPCVDKGFGCNQEVDVVIRPEDIEVSTDTTHRCV